VNGHPAAGHDVLAPLDRVSDAVWSAAVADAATGAQLAVRDPDRVLPAASMGKLLLLLEAAAGMLDGRLDPTQLLARTADDAVSDSGLWQHLRLDALPAEDVALLVGTVSDNLATNVLLRHVGLDAVAAASERLGLPGFRLLDRVRDVRTAADPPWLSEASASALVRFAGRLAADDSPQWSALRRWLAPGVDLSLVAAGLGLDPLAHVDGDRGLRLINKTGTDAGVRADAGILDIGGRVLAYAVIARWEPQPPHDPVRDDVLAAMRAVGVGLLSMRP
jgi:beta-lactamase class A